VSRERTSCRGVAVLVCTYSRARTLAPLAPASPSQGRAPLEQPAGESKDQVDIWLWSDGRVCARVPGQRCQTHTRAHPIHNTYFSSTCNTVIPSLGTDCKLMKSETECHQYHYKLVPRQKQAFLTCISSGVRNCTTSQVTHFCVLT
jgi:hypothetical protein